MRVRSNRTKCKQKQVSTGRAVKNTRTCKHLDTAVTTDSTVFRLNRLAPSIIICQLRRFAPPVVAIACVRPPHTQHSQQLMAANGDNNDDEGPFDPWTAPYDFNDVMHLLHIPGGLYPPPATAPMESVTTGCSYGCNNPFDWTMPMPGNGRGYSFVESSAPPVAMAGPSTSAHRQDVHASSSSNVNQGVLLDCTGCQLLREIQHSNGTHSYLLLMHIHTSIMHAMMSRSRPDYIDLFNFIPGFETTKLCIHGAAGLFYHATLEVHRVNPEGTALEPTHRSFVE
jgi:hypothetical protein